jgi:hypothetical protein
MYRMQCIRHHLSADVCKYSVAGLATVGNRKFGHWPLTSSERVIAVYYRGS